MLSSCRARRHDEQRRIERPPRQRHEEVVGVIGERGDKSVRPFDAGGPQRGVERGVTHDRRRRNIGDSCRVAVDDDDVAAFTLEVSRDCPTDTAPPAQHDVPSQIGDSPVHPSPPDDFSKLSIDDHLHAQGERVQHGADTDGDQRDREDLLCGIELSDLTESDRGDRRERLVQRIDQRQPEDQVADSACDQHEHHHPRGDAEARERRGHGREASGSRSTDSAASSTGPRAAGDPV